MEWELILIELLVALMVFFFLAFCGVVLGWLWMMFNRDLVERRMKVRKDRRKWEDEE